MQALPLHVLWACQPSGLLPVSLFCTWRGQEPSLSWEGREQETQPKGQGSEGQRWVLVWQVLKTARLMRAKEELKLHLLRKALRIVSHPPNHRSLTFYGLTLKSPLHSYLFCKLQFIPSLSLWQFSQVTIVWNLVSALYFHFYPSCLYLGFYISLLWVSFWQSHNLHIDLSVFFDEIMCIKTSEFLCISQTMQGIPLYILAIISELSFNF